MHLTITEEQDALRDAVARFLEKASTAESVREAEPLGWDPKVWSGLTDMGVPTLGVSEEQGGSGASLRDLAVVAQACGARLVAAPVVETMVAARLLARFASPAGDGGPGGAAAALTRLIDGGPPVVLAVRPAVNGVAHLVPGGAVAAAVVALDGDDLVVVDRSGRADVADAAAAADPGATGVGIAASPANLGSAPLADIDLAEIDLADTDLANAGRLAGSSRTVLATGPDAHAAFALAVDEWRALTARWLVGLGREAQAIGIQYAKDRKQFGVPIGSFQAVQHRFADLATDLDGADLLSNKAVWALDVGDAVASSFPAMAFWFAGDTAQRAASWGLHVHGGYGFMEEFDIQLYYRRAKAWAVTFADPHSELLTVADRRFGPAPSGDE